MEEYLLINEAYENNLKRINLKLPHNKLIVITGVSGSGKSSLAIDTIFAEGQRRFLSSLSTYTRQFLEKMPKPKVKSISGILPAIALEQKNPVKTARSTVGTVTEIYDYLRLFYARIGSVYCNSCGREVKKTTEAKLLQTLITSFEGEEVFIGFTYTLPRKLTLEQKKEHLLKEGLLRIYFDGSIKDIHNIPISAFSQERLIVIIDHFTVSKENRERIIESINTAYSLSEGEVIFINNRGEKQAFSTKFCCNYCKIDYLEPSATLLSFNNPFGACKRCNGFGYIITYDPKLIIPDTTSTPVERAIEPWNTPLGEEVLFLMKRVARRYSYPFNLPYKELPEEVQKFIWEGRDEFPGIYGFFEFLESKRYKVQVRVLLSRYRGYLLCPECKGFRLRPQALAIKVGGKHIGELSNLSIDSLLKFLKNLSISEEKRKLIINIEEQLLLRLNYLVEVGLGYITLNRRFATLSGGEAQRVRLSTAIGNSLAETLYVLDEPTLGLHPRDTRKLLKILKKLTLNDNTVIVVEHDRDVIKESDYIVELGPGAGKDGGRVVFSGSYSDILATSTITAKYLKGEKTIANNRRKNHSSTSSYTCWLTIKGINKHNLRNLSINIPLQKFVCITGVSGSGKSTLVNEIIYPGVKNMLEKKELVPEIEGISGLENIDEVVLVEQATLEKTPRANIATTFKLFDEIRKIFASTPSAILQGLTPAHFSFNTGSGRCTRCQGMGKLKIEMQFMADIFIPCPDCDGMRYKPEILEIKFQGKNIVEVLELTVEEALEFFSFNTQIYKRLKVLTEVGLGYITLGQPLSSFSLGESQRLKLAKYLGHPSTPVGVRKVSKQKYLFLFDEPTIGLHFEDINLLVKSLEKLLAMGNSIIIIEHNLDLIQLADYIIDLGPEGGEGGGKIVAAGTPDVIMNTPASYTGKELARFSSLFKHTEDTTKTT